MPKRRTIIVEELDPQGIDSFSDAQKEFYASMGYKPYMNEDDKIVWLSPELHSLRIHAKTRRPFLSRLIFKKKIAIPQRRRHRNWFVKLIRHNWLLFLILIGVMAFVLFYMNYYYLAP
ncbi:MAG: hypothetical protein CVU50_01115 [Candidatus Cloacimonetes bacterium HGW-Cloacimonetes-3]|jgi:hypothetical protein|nr:MAG: hypothetical protein CVU50_01115 [Candidatus Cloacimonetes bacterium HGW-Cloacimonetes-3]